jgi:tetratricopeptide (TPR) repeat protein
MPEKDELVTTTRKSTELWQLGEPHKALKLLDDSISEAIRGDRPLWVRTLALHAAVIADFIGDLRRARQYREQCVAYGPDDPMALYGLAKVLLEQGERERAKEYAASAYRLCMQGGTELDRVVIDAIIKRWPELAAG